jgi:hypothetical protein
MMMKPCQTLQKDSTQERERKRNKRDKHQSPGKQNSPKEAGHKEERAPLRTKPSTRNI